MRLSSYIASATSVPGGLRHPSNWEVLYEAWKSPPSILVGLVVGFLGVFFAVFNDVDAISTGLAFLIALVCVAILYHLVIGIITLRQIRRAREDKDRSG